MVGTDSHRARSRMIAPKVLLLMTVDIRAHRSPCRITSPTTADIARRNELVEEAIPLAKLIVSTYCRDHGIFGLREEIEAEALAGLLNLADTYRPASPWLKYVNRNLKFRLIDAMRRRFGPPEREELRAPLEHQRRRRARPPARSASARAIPPSPRSTRPTPSRTRPSACRNARAGSSRSAWPA